MVLAVFAINHLPAGCELGLAFGTVKSCALPMCHALTDCNTALSFAGHGKKTAWSKWKSLPELIDVLLMLEGGPKQIPDDAMRFVIRLFDRTSNCTKEALSTKQNSVHQIPPTRAALGACQESSIPG